MSRHVGRNERWTRSGPGRYTSELGEVVYRERAWYAVLKYQTRAETTGEGGPPPWLPHSDQLGPFKRPRNAMVALEREATFLRNRHGDNLRLGGP